MIKWIGLISLFFSSSAFAKGAEKSRKPAQASVQIVTVTTIGERVTQFTVHNANNQPIIEMLSNAAPKRQNHINAKNYEYIVSEFKSLPAGMPVEKCSTMKIEILASGLGSKPQNKSYCMDVKNLKQLAYEKFATMLVMAM